MLGNLIKKGLVSGLDTVSQLQMMETYKDCIFEKIHVKAYNKEVVCEAEILECVYIDLWGPSPVVSASGACYFMLIMDGTSMFWYIKFLREKIANTTLNVLKKFLAEAERLTRKKVLWVRVDRGREWDN